MYLINESICELKNFFQEEVGIDEMGRRLSGTNNTAFSVSAWEDYEDCPSMNATCMKYRIDTPIELAELLRNLWSDQEMLRNEEFIRLFTVSAFRQLISGDILKECKEETFDINISPFVYNF